MKILYPVILLVFFGQLCLAQKVFLEDTSATAFPDSLLRVDSVKISGNDDTKDFVIIREMTLKQDSLITYAAVSYDMKRIYSLGLFNRVHIEVEPTSGTKANLIVNVHERWYIYPYPIVGLKDRDWSKIYYGLGLVHVNFRGRNEKLYGSFALGFDPWVSLSYRNPFLDESGNEYLDTRLVYNKVKNRSVLLQQQVGDFDETQFSASATLGERFGIQHTIWGTLGYRYNEIPQPVVTGTSVVGEIDRFPQFSVGYTYDTRDLQEYAAFGSFLALTVSQAGVWSNPIDYAHYSVDYRRYIPLNSSLTLAARSFGVLSSGGVVPSYDHVFLGYGDRIRGHFREVMEGEDLFGFSTELHYQLISPFYVKVNFLPREFSLWRFALNAALFGDAGTTWFRGQGVDFWHMPSGYGGGLHFLFPYDIIIRTEYAWNEMGRGEFMLTAGASF